MWVGENESCKILDDSSKQSEKPKCREHLHCLYKQFDRIFRSDQSSITLSGF